MVPVPSLVVLLGLTLCMIASHKTMAQQFNEGGVVYEAARNKIGLIGYCRRNQLLDPVIADQAVAAVETGFRNMPPLEALAKEQGDRAQQAGEDGFWEVGRRRDINSVAKLFLTTPEDLCQEWADETLRGQGDAPRNGGATTITAVRPAKPAQPSKPSQPFVTASQPFETIQIVPQKSEPIQIITQSEPIAISSGQAAVPADVEALPDDKPALRVPALVKAARAAPAPSLPAVPAPVAEAAPIPPMPERAPGQPIDADPAFQRALPPGGGSLASAAKAAPAPARAGSKVAAAPAALSQPSGQGGAGPVRLATGAPAAPLAPRDQTLTAAVSPPPADEKPPSVWEKWGFSRLGRTDRCLMPGCKWKAPQEKRSYGY